MFKVDSKDLDVFFGRKMLGKGRVCSWIRQAVTSDSDRRMQSKSARVDGRGRRQLPQKERLETDFENENAGIPIDSIASKGRYGRECEAGKVVDEYKSVCDVRSSRVGWRFLEFRRSSGPVRLQQ